MEAAHEITEDTHKKQQHPLLQRHYSTIGVGDVFLEGPDHALPSDYLSKAKNRSQLTTFASWEMVGTIKSTPEDFVVREIGLKGRIIPGLTEQDVEDMRVANLSPIRIPVYSEKATQPNKKTKEEPERVKPRGEPKRLVGIEESESKLPWRTKQVTSDDVKEDPMENLKRMLEHNLSRVSKTNHHDYFSRLDELQTKVVECIQQLKTGPGQSEVNVKDLDTIELPPLGTNSKEERGAFHRALRVCFPLLKSETVADKDQSMIRVAVDNSFFGIIPYLHDPQTDLPVLYKFYKKGFDADCSYRSAQSRDKAGSRRRSRRGGGRSSSHDTRSLDEHGTGPILRLRPDLERNERRPVHQIINSATSDFLGTSTIPDYPLNEPNSDDTPATTAAIAVHWSRTAERRLNKKRKRTDQEAQDEDELPHVLFVLKKRQREHLTAIQTLVKALGCRQSDIGLAGIKDMQAVTYQFCTVRDLQPERVLGAAASLKTRGIEVANIHKVDWDLRKGDLEGNRFKLVVRNLKQVQVSARDGHAEETFTTCSFSHVTAMVDRVRKSGFLNFYGEQRVGTAGLTSIVGVRACDIGRAILQKDFAKAIDLIMTGRLVCHGSERESEAIRLVRQTWKESGGDPIATSKKLPRGNNMPRERLILKGMKRYGKDDPIAILKCVHRNERVFWINAYQSLVWNLMATERIRCYGTKVVQGDLILEEGDNSAVKYVTEHTSQSDLTLQDVVLPMPGSDVQYPSNGVGKLYKEVLDRDGITFEKESLLETTARGFYRRLVAMPSNAGFDLKFSESSPGTLDLSLTFDLPKGCYATMFLRELMVTTVARDT